MEAIALSAYQASIELAKEKGPFPLFDADGFLRKGSFAAERLPIEMQDDIRKHGICNALLTSIAPTGTISLYAGNVSSGIEPIFAYSYTRKVLQADGSKVEEEVVDYAVALFHEMYPGEELPDYFTTAQHLKPAEHLRMQAAAQRWVDSSISKTINVPEDISFEDFRDVYEEAYEQGCKGCTTYRPNDVTGSVLEVKTDKPKAAVPDNAPADRPKRLEGATYKLKWPNEPHAFYITFTDQIDDAGGRRPFEIFINSKNVDHFQWTVALTRMVSAVFRRGGNVSFVAGELREVFDPKGGAWMSGEYVPSLLAAIGNIVAEHMTEIGYGDFKGGAIVDQEVEGEVEIIQTTVAPQHKCVDCGSYNVKKEAGCFVCKDCGSSKCG
jgi:ribonucleoside-diphosphate reductase alpha chain